MPTFYEGAPILEASFKINKDLYTESLYKEEISKSILKRKEFKASFFIFLALLFGINIPNFYRNYGDFIFPIVLMIVCVVFRFVCAVKCR